MFASQIPTPERFSAKRLAWSILLHGVALALAISLRFSAPAEPASAAPTRVSLLAPAPRLAPIPVLPRRMDPPAPKLAPRAFSAPVIILPPRARAAFIEAALPEQPPPPPPLLESRQPTTLPPPPIVVGKLATATSVEPSRAPQPTARATTFGGPAPSAAEPEHPRATKLSGFGNASVSTEPQHRSTATAATKAVEILAKPRPLYSEEARLLKIEGEVLLEVLFTSAGAARVERILRGLGHGLDESAAVAAAAISFRPAQRAGQPVDQLATVHITFQLAY